MLQLKGHLIDLGRAPCWCQSHHLLHKPPPSSPHAPRCHAEPLLTPRAPPAAPTPQSLTRLPSPPLPATALIWSCTCFMDLALLQNWRLPAGKQCLVRLRFCTIGHCSEPFFSHRREEGPASSSHSPQTRDLESAESPSKEYRK